MVTDPSARAVKPVMSSSVVTVPVAVQAPPLARTSAAPPVFVKVKASVPVTPAFASGAVIVTAAGVAFFDTVTLVVAYVPVQSGSAALRSMVTDPSARAVKPVMSSKVETEPVAVQAPPFARTSAAPPVFVKVKASVPVTQALASGAVIATAAGVAFFVTVTDVVAYVPVQSGSAALRSIVTEPSARAVKPVMSSSVVTVPVAVQAPPFARTSAAPPVLVKVKASVPVTQALASGAVIATAAGVAFFVTVTDVVAYVPVQSGSAALRSIVTDPSARAVKPVMSSSVV